MARIATDPNYTTPTFSRATAGTDLFVSSDVQGLAAAVSTHDHSIGKGLPLVAGAIPDGTITSAKIANGTIVAADIAPGTITSNEIADGTIVAADLANASVTNAKLASDTARANLLANGGFEIWQRGVGAFTGNGTYTADKWVIQLNGTDTVSVVRDGANIDAVNGSNFAAQVTYTKGNGANTNLQQVMKTSDYQVRGRTVTFSARVLASVPNGCIIGIGTDGSPAGSASSAAHPGTNVYQTLSATVAVPANATVIFFYIFFSVTSVYVLDNAMVVVGSQAADYAPLHPADDLARCLRYYEQLGDVANDMAVNSYHIASGVFQIPIRFKAQKAVTPTLTKVGTWAVTNCAQPGATAPASGGFVLFTTVTASAGFTFVNDAVGKNFVAEANP